jgi:type IV secretory pathway TrbF-like protein
MRPPITVRKLRETDFDAWLPLCNGYNAFYGRIMNDAQNWILIAFGVLIAGYFLIRKTTGNANGLKSTSDPLAEAEVYLAYGRKQQAQEVLENALQLDPSRTDIEAKLRDLKSQM